MAVAGSLIVNVAADAAKFEQGLAQARQASKGFAVDTIKDLKGIDKTAAKLQKSMRSLADASSVGALLGTAAGGGLGGVVGSVAFDAAFKAVSHYIERAEKGAALIVEKLNEAEATGKRLEGIDLISANQVRNAKQAWDSIWGKDDGGVGAAVGMAPMKEAFAAGILATQEKLTENAKAMQQIWQAIPEAIRGAIPGAEGMAAAMQKAADFGKDIAQTSKEHAEATAKAAELQKQINQRAFKPVVDEAGAGMQWIGGARDLANLQLAAADQERAFQARAKQVIAEQNRLDKIRPEVMGPTGALIAGSSAEFSATAKARRTVEAQAQKADPAERDAKKIAEKMLKIEQDQLKRLDDVVEELKGNAKVKQAKF